MHFGENLDQNLGLFGPKNGPAVDALNSTSKMLDPSYVKQEHFYVATNVKQMLQRYEAQLCWAQQV